MQDFDITQKAAFFFGVEKEGLSDDILQNADVSLKIPMYGFTESLNISVAAAIVLQHCSTKLHQSNINWTLSDVEKQSLELEWTKKSIKDVGKIIDRYMQKRNS